MESQRSRTHRILKTDGSIGRQTKGGRMLANVGTCPDMLYLYALDLMDKAHDQHLVEDHG